MLATFPEALTDEQRVADDLAELGALVERPEANVIKLPNVSASIPQLKATIEELQAKGYTVPDYPDEPSSTDEERDVQARYDKVKGSAVNPVLREGNSDRRAPGVGEALRPQPPAPMGAWSPDSKTHVATMGGGDFYANEQSVTIAERRRRCASSSSAPTAPSRCSRSRSRSSTGEVVDATFMSAKALDAFLAEQIADAKAEGRAVLDPPQGHDDEGLRPDHLRPRGEGLLRRRVREARATPSSASASTANDGLGDVLARVATLPDTEQTAIEADIAAAMAAGAARSPWSTPTAASPTCTCRATSSSTPRCPR